MLDETGAEISAAPVTLRLQSGESYTTNTDAEGNYSFPALPAGEFALTVTAPGFSTFTNPQIVLAPGQTVQITDVTLHVAAVSSHADVTASKREVAEAQMQSEVKQRLIGILPNYYVVYYKDPVPLTAGQKMHLAFRLAIDPVNIGIDAAQAAAQTNSENYKEYGTGAEGFGKRFAAAYADDFIGTIVGSGLINALLRQDPRYYYKGTGTVPSRVLYALSWSFRCKGDNGKWQLNYSALLGHVVTASISNLYYPQAISNSPGETAKYSALGLASEGANALLQEFLFKKLTTHSHDPGKL
ncbi:MAG TPA: carboxypeptidase-like regulatory domain-containing protein [Bryobacteraceae bacterium]|nr:carboxypeptidase-like regulatory domain-containing protein [Bryobacteraceae bacterium]